MGIEQIKESLEKKGYQVSLFETGEQAAAYLKETVKGQVIGFGGSQTLADLNLFRVLSEQNTVIAPDYPAEGEDFFSLAIKSIQTGVFFLSANAISEDGTIVNMDWVGNRLNGSMFGHQKVYYVVGENKLGGSLEEAIARVRNVAAPKNALRLGFPTPCAAAVAERLQKKFREETGAEGEIDPAAWNRFLEKLSPEELGTRCYDCSSPQRICGSMLLHLQKPIGMAAEVILIREKLGF